MKQEPGRQQPGIPVLQAGEDVKFDRLSGDQLDDIRAFRGLLAANRKMYERHLAPTDDMFAAPSKQGPVVVFKKPAPDS